ncbi:uncharacterized protein Z520_06201 [Fonsecaea multimorphosa CBS 102226]|uniref:UBA domain-containing protein n=1 Tax=Fonsecaea multimorphosa CBS 102226 TaxID=1442371 RepID=A0A0D2IM74_9EURO|nr:uncharacterized protein Z520_06201 [Fonsecaea multimorphosa CBS 102226]KIX98121.1 hypothetical protein Z520_06201 [Fonsecaea multimorphosa CBS 102226]OAL24196.1 hypothetical protein AYO22_05856 [Fonsecaea multimorphosa]
MTSVLRLGNKDRSSFSFFKRQSSDNTSDVSSDNLAHRLPDISHVDTRSFAELFDEFMTKEINDVPKVQVQTEATQAPKLLKDIASNPPAQTTLSTKAFDTKVDFLKVNITRNDSAASSCYSQPSQRDSDCSPLVTRQSSSSSYTQEPSPANQKTVTLKPTPISIPKRLTQGFWGNFTESPVSAQPSPSRANSSLIRVVSVPPNLDKPLPPGPTDIKRASTSVPDLLLRQPLAELPSVFPISTTHSSTKVQRTYSQPSVMVSMRRSSDGGAVSELPAWSSRSMRGPSSERTASHGHHRNRSVSDTEVPHPGRSLTQVSRRHTVDMQKLALTATSSFRPNQTARKQNRRPITAATAERVIYRIMCSLHSAQDLQATAMVSKGFLRTFQRNESKLVSHLIFKTSRAAWELRRSILALKGSNDFLLKDYRRDCRTLDALKAFIVAHCSSSCKRSTLVGLLGQDDDRKARVDDALWRIWTFCTLFGNTVGQSGPAQTEIDWLNGSRAATNKQLGAGFAIGNGKGLATHELEDMNEMWQCLQILMSGFYGREQEAKRYGVFDNWHLRDTTSESQHLVEWTSYLLALGPQTVLSLSSCSFEQAKMLGLTNWPIPQAGQSRSSFLTTAIAQVYQERVLEDATRRAARMSLRHIPGQNSVPRAPVHRPTRSLDEQMVNLPSARATIQSQPLRIDTSSLKRRPISTNAFAEVRLEIRPDCDPANDRQEIRPDCDPGSRMNRASHLLPTSPSTDPTVYHSLSMTSTASTKLGATLFPMDYASPAPRVPFRTPEPAAATASGIVDPVDKAMNLLVREYGFPETRARKALAMCDSGSGIDLQKAIELLTVDSKDAQKGNPLPVELPTPASVASSNRLKKAQPSKAYCDGHCSRTPTFSHSRNKSTGTTGTGTDVSLSPVSALGEEEWQDTISPLLCTPTLGPRLKAPVARGPSKAKAWKVLGMDSLPKRKNSVLHIDEYQAKVERRKSMRANTNGEQQSSKIKEGLGKNLLGLGLGIGSGAGAKSAEAQLERVREEERRKKEKNRTSCMPRYA